MSNRSFLPQGSALTGLILLFSLFLAPDAVLPAPRTWFFFRDKGPASLKKEAYATAAAMISPQALARRARVMPAGELITESDLPVYPEYIAQLQALGITPRRTSRWLNGVSAEATPEQIAAAAGLPCIAAIQPVARQRREIPQNEPLLSKPAASSDTPLDYGYSLGQNEQVQITELHRRGFYGQGVIIAVFDTGFRLNHEAFDSLQVLAAYDFIQDDENLDTEGEERVDQSSHGTMVLSVLAGYKPGQLVGSAPRARYILAKTEDVSREVESEEDNWIAAAEWAEALGADLFSTSLGYIDWYTNDDMDGNTAPITRAADLAAGKGVLVINSAGNEGNDLWRLICAPADGDSVLAIGAVDGAGKLISFSSRGPTADGRIKPDLMAQGGAVACIDLPPRTGLGAVYRAISGTSAACPIAAGAAALILCANPGTPPMIIADALRKTATRAQMPDTDYGWGIIQALAAAESTAAANKPVVLPESSSLVSLFPNPASVDLSDGLRIVLNMTEAAVVEVRLYNILGQEVGTLFRGQVPAGKERWIKAGWPAGASPRLASGVYLLSVKTANIEQRRTITLLSSGAP